MKEKGITLVALVVMIIVLIILAGVSINLVLGTEGIITTAKRAKENIEYAQIEEQRKLNELYIQIEENDVEVGGEIEKLNDFKKAIADYIEEAGGIKPDYMADTLTFGEKIKGIVKEVTKDATAKAEDIKEGKFAWVNGEKVEGSYVGTTSYCIPELRAYGNIATGSADAFVEITLPISGYKKISIDSISLATMNDSRVAFTIYLDNIQKYTTTTKNVNNISIDIAGHSTLKIKLGSWCTQTSVIKNIVIE